VVGEAEINNKKEINGSHWLGVSSNSPLQRLSSGEAGDLRSVDRKEIEITLCPVSRRKRGGKQISRTRLEKLVVGALVREGGER
jgi:hypothetical protein